MQPYWLKQEKAPLYPNLLWARPESKANAGKLLVVGGHAQSFAAVAEAYAAAEKAGIGIVRVILPDALQRTVGKLFPAAEFAPSNPSGGFARLALGELVAAATWSDGVLLAGDLGRNSETLAMLENFVSKYQGQLTITKDVGDFFCTQPQALLNRSFTSLVISMGQLQQLGVALRTPYALSSQLPTLGLIDALHRFTTEHRQLYIATYHYGNVVVGVEGLVSTTAIDSARPTWRMSAAGAIATWQLQNPQQPFASLSSAVWENSHI